MDGHQKILSQEDRHLTGLGDAGAVLKDGEMQDEEKIVLILVDFGKLDFTQAVIEVERVEWIILSKVVHLLPRGSFDICPRKILPGNFVDSGLFFGRSECSGVTFALADTRGQPHLNQRKKIAHIIRVKSLDLPVLGDFKNRSPLLALSQEVSSSSSQPFQETQHSNPHIEEMYLSADSAAIAPSPVAATTCRIEPARMSPAANIPGTPVSI